MFAPVSDFQGLLTNPWLKYARRDFLLVPPLEVCAPKGWNYKKLITGPSDSHHMLILKPSYTISVIIFYLVVQFKLRPRLNKNIMVAYWHFQLPTDFKSTIGSEPWSEIILVIPVVHKKTRQFVYSFSVPLWLVSPKICWKYVTEILQNLLPSWFDISYK